MKGAGPQVVPITESNPSSLSDTEEGEKEEEKEGERVVATGAPLAAADNGREWIKNFASPQCGAKLGMTQLLLLFIYVCTYSYIHIYIVTLFLGN